MAGSVKSIIAENGLQVSDVTNNLFRARARTAGLRSLSNLPQLIRCRGPICRGGYYVSTYGQSVREAVNKWLDWCDWNN